jgi:glycosyltransferase involved in cell wall biosynthesis
VLAQTYENLVVHVSDNASTDDTIKIVENICDSRVYIHRSEINVGGEGNVNSCIQLAEGKYTAIYHADDVYEPDIVEKQVAQFERHETAGAVFTAAKVIDEDGKTCGWINIPDDVIRKGNSCDFKDLFQALLRHSNFLICPSAMVRTEIYKKKIMAMRGNVFGSAADLDMWLRIAQSHEIVFIDEPLMQYRVSDFQFSSQIRRQILRSDFFLVIEHYIQQRNVRSFLNFKDFQNLARLERRDRVMRAVNLVVMGQASHAKDHLTDIFSREAFKAALQSKRGISVLAMGIYLKLLLSLQLNNLAQRTLGYFKHVWKK